MIGNNNIEYRRKFSVNFLVVMLYEHIYWIDHVKTIEYKIAKKIVLLYRVSQFLKKILLKLHISDIFIPI